MIWLVHARVTFALEKNRRDNRKESGIKMRVRKVGVKVCVEKSK